MRPRPRVHATPVRRRPSLDFSLTGLVYCSMMMFMGLAAINSQANLLFGVFGLMIGILFVSGWISRRVLRGLRMSRKIPEHLVVGEVVAITYEVKNTKFFWPSLSVTIAELDGAEGFTRQPICYVLHAAARNQAVVPVEVIPTRRGLYELGRHQLSTSFPFGFIKRAIERREHETVAIFPALAKVNPKVIKLCLSAEKTGPTIRPRRGGLDEFYGVKEYRAGENPRWIHWKRSARTGVLVSKEMTQVSPPRLMLLVDTFITERSLQEHILVERSVAIAASLANDALAQGLSVGLCAWSGHWVAIAPNRGKRQRRDLLATLAHLPLNQTHPAEALLAQGRQLAESGTTSVLLTPRNMQLSLADKLRGGLVILPADSDQSHDWFRFDTSVDFACCMPADQQPEWADDLKNVHPSPET